jgi:hypothetical protein
MTFRFGLLLGVVASCAPAQFLHLDAATDTVMLPFSTGNMSSITMEARVLTCGNSSVLGLIFQEQYNALEDKALFCSAVGAGGTMWEPSNPFFILAPPFVACPTWRHIASVFDGAQERFYVNGLLVATRAHSGLATGVSQSAMSLGGFKEPAGPQTVRPGFVGYVDFFRLSSVARYSGSNFIPPSEAEIALDAATLLFFKFDDGPSATTVVDLASAVVGQFGAGFSTATMPAIVASIPCVNGVAASATMLSGGAFGASATTLDGSPPVIGGALVLEATGAPAGSLGTIYLGVPLAAPLVVPGLPDIWVDPSTLFPLFQMAADAQGRASLGLPLPCDPLLQGFAVRLQGAFIGVAPQSFSLTNALDLSMGW